MPKSNMPKHAERRNMPETCPNQTCRSTRKEETCRNDSIFAYKWSNFNRPKPNINVRLCHSCHAKRWWMWQCATPATWNAGECEVVPRLPRKVPRRHRRPSGTKRATQCHLSHACHAKRWWMWQCATPATWNAGECEVVPRLPRKVPRRHRGPSGTKRATQYHLSDACHAKRRLMWHCATPATWNEGGCQVVPRLPRKVPRRHRRPSGTKRATQYHLSHACHAKRRLMWHCATPATWNEGGCQVVPRLPRKVPRRHRRPSGTKRDTQYHLSHACHAKRRLMWHCATPATWNAGECEVVPRLPRKVPRRHRRPSGTKRDTQCHLSHACHAKRRLMWHCATPATWNAGECEVVPRLPRKVPRRHRRPSGTKRATQCHLSHACHAKRRLMWHCATPATQNDGGCAIVPSLCMWSDCMLSLCVGSFCVLTKCVLTKSVWTKCVLTKCVWTKCVWTKCMWTKCVLTKCVLTKCMWTKCVLTKCVLTKCVLTKSVWTKIVLTKCVWTKSVWTKCVLTKCVLTKSVWTKSVLTKCVWTKSVWTKSVLTKCVWTKECVDKECVDKVCVDKVCEDRVCGGGREDEEEAEEAAGYRNKNKNPTQSCGEKHLSTIWSWPFGVRIFKSRNICANLLGICGVLQLAPVHSMVLCNINSLHGTLSSHDILQQCEANICRLHDACKVWTLTRHGSKDFFDSLFSLLVCLQYFARKPAPAQRPQQDASRCKHQLASLIQMWTTNNETKPKVEKTCVSVRQDVIISSTSLSVPRHIVPATRTCLRPQAEVLRGE